MESLFYARIYKKRISHIFFKVFFFLMVSWVDYFLLNWVGWTISSIESFVSSSKKETFVREICLRNQIWFEVKTEGGNLNSF